jgi:hypothetical protein
VSELTAEFGSRDPIGFAHITMTFVDQEGGSIAPCTNCTDGHLVSTSFAEDHLIVGCSCGSQSEVRIVSGGLVARCHCH